MTDIVTYCDINTCEDCPRYGDDCDGDKRVEHTDYIRRADAVEAVKKIVPYVIDKDTGQWGILVNKANVITELSALPSAEADAVQGEWIPCSERLPEDMKPVIVTWKNTDPKSYYQYIVGKHFIGTAHYMNGKWFWYSSVTEDLLAEYGRCDGEEFDEAIEVVAWTPLPKPYKGGDSE